MNTPIAILPADLHHLLPAVMSQRADLRARRCPADLRRLRLQQVAVAEAMAARLTRAACAGSQESCPKDFQQWVAARGWDGRPEPSAA